MDSFPPTGRYEIVEKIGEGGMGKVYLARDRALGRLVALKVLSIPAPELRERFAREARSAASLTHPNIVTIFDFSEEQAWIAMEYLDGENLSELIRRKRPGSLLRRVELMLELCAGLGYAHRAEIIHRDIKPANVMITSGGILKILDFGLARWSDENTMTGLTRAGVLVGSPHYMSPEQIQEFPVDHRSDIFAVGTLLYEFISFRKAFPGDTWQTVFAKILNSEPVPLTELYEDIDPDVERIVSKCIAKSPDARYPQLAAVADDLRRVRDRLRASAEDPTIRLDREHPGGQRADEPTPKLQASQGRNLEAIAKRRAEQINKYIADAQDACRAGNFEHAIEQCELAIVLDPSEPRALQLLDEAQDELEERQVNGWLAEAEELLFQRSLTAADALIARALQVRPESEAALWLQKTVQQHRIEQQHKAERARAARSAVERGLANFRDEAFEAAIRSANEALVHEPENVDARSLKRDAIAALEVQRQRLRDEQVTEVIEEASRLSADHRYDIALRLLATVTFEHPSLKNARVSIEEKAAAHEARLRAEEEARRRAEEAAKRQAEEEARRRAEEAAKRRAEEEARRRAEEEAKRQAEEEARRRVEEEAKRRAEEEARRRAEEETERREKEEKARSLAEAEARAARVKSAAKVAVSARRLFVMGQPAEALRLLESFEPRSLVEDVISELREQWEMAVATTENNSEAGAAVGPSEETAPTSVIIPSAVEPSSPTAEIAPFEPPANPLKSRRSLIVGLFLAAVVILSLTVLWIVVRRGTTETVASVADDSKRAIAVDDDPARRAEAARQAQAKAAREAQEAARRAQEEADRRAQQELTRAADDAKKAEEEARKAEQDAARSAQEKERQAQIEAQRRQVEETARRAQEDDRRARDEATRKAQEDAARRSQDDAARRAQEEAARGRQGRGTAASPRPEPPPVPIPSLPEETAQALLRRYAETAGRFDNDGLNEIFPNFPRDVRDRLEALRKDYSQCDYAFSNVQISVRSNTAATVRADTVETCRPKIGRRPPPRTSVYQFDLVKTNSGQWIIERVAY